MVLDLGRLESGRLGINPARRVHIRWDYYHNTNAYSAYLYCNDQSFNLYANPGSPGQADKVDYVKNTCDRWLPQHGEQDIRRVSDNIRSSCKIDDAYYILKIDLEYRNASKIFESYLIDECITKTQEVL